VILMAAFQETITAAIREFEIYGYDSPTRLDDWLARIIAAAEESLVPAAKLEEELRRSFGAIYSRLIDKGGIMKMHKGVARFTVDRLKPQMVQELQRRQLASSQLIRLNRQRMVQQTAQRFSGWATSIPAGGSDAIDKLDVKTNLRKALGSLPFEERRVMIDQGHKFTSALNNIIALDGGALAAMWHSHWRQPGYNYRPDHKERDMVIYTIRGNWALANGSMKVGPAGYLDDITQPAEEPFCRCFAQYLYNLRDLPDNMLTNKGKEVLGR